MVTRRPRTRNCERAVGARGGNRGAPGPGLQKYRMKGDLPSFNDWQSMVVDHQACKVYIYGGCRPCDDVPTSHLYVCDMSTMRWLNLTNQLRYLSNPVDPFAIQLHARCLPALHQPAAAFITLNGRKFLLLFGGRSNHRTMAELVAIDVDELTWWVVHVDEGPITARTNASMVAVNNRIYVFGGMDPEDSRIASFSIACYDNGRWTWEVRDAPYPESLPDLGYSGGALAVYGGKKILLTMGRSRNEDPISLSRETTILFHTTHHTFQAQSATFGEFPKDVSWYDLHAFSPHANSASAKPPFSPVRRRASAKGQSGSSSRQIDVSFQPVSISPRAMICGWVPHSDDYLVPELWQYMLPPEETMICLNLREKIWELNSDLQAFCVVGNKIFLLGYEGETEPNEDERNLVWNVCVEVFLECSA